MISKIPVLDEPLGYEHRPQALEILREFRLASLLRVDAMFDTLRHYAPQHWRDVLDELRQAPATSKWFRT